jgi:alkyl hydroperoxide reductase subunit AhpC
VRDHHKEIEALGATVLFLSFGQIWQAKRWLEETGVPYPLLLDPDRRVYRAYGLKRSIAAAWHPRMFVYYFRLLRRGRKLRPIQGDPYQLGGDFVVDRKGILRFAHPSRDPLDRPDIVTVLNALENACQTE